MNRVKPLPLSIQPGGRETWQTPELLMSPTEALRFNFPFINSGRYRYERGVDGWRKEGGEKGGCWRDGEGEECGI